MNRKPTKYPVFFAVIALVCLTAGIVSAANVTQSITYQGKLTDENGNPLEGTYTIDITFRLYSAESGGTMYATDTHAVTVSDGLFTTPVTFATQYVDGRPLWLSIEVKSDGEMTPRQEIRPVPYALGLRPGAVGSLFTTSKAGTSWPGSPGVDVSTLFNLNPGIRINTSGPYSEGVYTETNSHHSAGVYAETIGATSPGVIALTDGDDSPGMYAQTSGTNSPGVYAGTDGDNSQGVYAATDGADSEGVWVETTGAGSDGVHAVTLNADSPGVYARTSGARSPGIYGSSTRDVGVYGIGKEGGYFTTNSAGTSSTDRPGVNVTTLFNYNSGVRINTTGNYSAGVHAHTYGDHSDGVFIRTFGDYSKGVDAYTYGDNSEGVFLRTFGDYSKGVFVSTRGTTSQGVYASTDGVGSIGVFAQSNQSYGVYGDTSNPSSYGIYTPDRLYAAGGVFPTADVAEYLPVTEHVTPGTVLVIGDNGELEVTSTAYDTRVAGIVSTSPGISLGAEEGGNEDEQIIAVAGRVPCKVDASYGAIHPGDVLTTSPKPGYAMKAEKVKSGEISFYLPSTVIGKALGTLESGTGTIEVLVTLQ